MADTPAGTSPSPAPTPAPAARAPEQFRFTGSAGEYFGIWITNLLLTIVTLGIYSAWAKVRRLQYFYRHAEVAGSSFDFHGRPLTILIGRIVAIALLLLYNFAARLHSATTLLIIVALALVMPWLLRNSLRFRLYNTSWRGTRFHFRGAVGASYRVFLLNGFLMLITLYLLAPFAHQRLKAYQHDNSWFGRTRCSFHASVGQFYKVYLVLLGFFVVLGMIVFWSGVGAIFTAASHASGTQTHVDPRTVIRTVVTLYAAVILASVALGPIFHALITNLIWSNTRVGEHRLVCRLAPLKLVWIVFSNFLLVIISLGLLTPLVQVRLARYQLASMQLLPASDLQEFEAAEPEKLGAVGEESATVFDFDISL